MKNTILFAAIAAFISFSSFAAEAMKGKLEDGTQVEVTADNHVNVWKDGKSSPAPKGTWKVTMENGESMDVMVDENGMMMKK